MAKLIYPDPDPAHLCTCECHANPDVNYFTGCVCCTPCQCGHNIAYEYEVLHAKTCVPRKDRHKHRKGQDATHAETVSDDDRSQP